MTRKLKLADATTKHEAMLPLPFILATIYSASTGSEGRKEGNAEAFNKPGSVPLPGRERARPLIWECRCRHPRASYPAAGRATSSAALLGLAPDGVCRAGAVTSAAVGSYIKAEAPTFSPLPVPGEPGHRRYVFCGTFLRVTPTGR